MYFWIITLVIALALPTQARAMSGVNDRYNGSIEFDVVREGKVVGEHITTFKQEGKTLLVSSRMKLDTFLLFIPVYGFDYKAEEKWMNNRLEQIEVAVLDGSDKLNFSATHRDNNLHVERGEERYTLPSPIISTNHWNADVVKTNKVLNTLTGNINNVQINQMGREKVKILNGEIEATRYDYQGDLTDTSVWYDDQNRWVKLRFKARDGSLIDYRCRTCTQETGS